jgi:hypothetical protein
VDASDWISIASGALALLAIVVSGFVARSQNVLARRDQLFPFITEMLDDYNTDEFKAILAYVREDFRGEHPLTPDGSGAALTPDDRTRLRPMMSFLNEVGLLMANKAIKSTLISSIMGGSVAESWGVLAPHNYARRIERGNDPNYFAYYEHLAAEMKKLGPQRLEGRLRLKRLQPASPTANTALTSSPQIDA